MLLRPYIVEQYTEFRSLPWVILPINPSWAWNWRIKLTQNYSIKYWILYTMVIESFKNIDWLTFHLACSTLESRSTMMVDHLTINITGFIHNRNCNINVFTCLKYCSWLLPHATLTQHFPHVSNSTPTKNLCWLLHLICVLL